MNEQQMSVEQGKAWRERAELAERENERLHAVVEELRETLATIRNETAFMDSPEMPIHSMRNAARSAHERSSRALGLDVA